MLSIVKDPVISANDLNDDPDLIYLWAYQWKLEFNPYPIKQATEVLFSCKKASPKHIQLISNETAVITVKGQKHLGLILEKAYLLKNILMKK